MQQDGLVTEAAVKQIADQIEQSNIKYEKGPPLEPAPWPKEWSAGYIR